MVPVDTFNELCHTTLRDEAAAANETLVAYEIGDQDLEPIRQLVLGKLDGLPEAEDEPVYGESFLNELARLLGSNKCRVVTSDRYLRLHKHDAMQESIAYIHDNLAETINLDVLCELCSMSRSTLVRHFKRFIGVTPRYYILAARLNRVRRDLLDPDYFDLSIAEIGMRHNLLHMGRLSAQYQVLFGRLPSQDREIAMNRARETT